MATIKHSQKTNFQPKQQKRKQGSGKGRKMFKWKEDMPWLVMASEQFYIGHSGSGEALLEDRAWVRRWNLSAAGLRDFVGYLFPGLLEYMDSMTGWKTPWHKRLHNRVYKMYYNGTSARGVDHNPNTRASVSNEHWRNWDCRGLYEEIILKAVLREEPYPGWRDWL